MVKKIRSYFRQDDASASLEFALLFIPYLLLTLGIIEISLMFTAGTLLEGATSSAGRLIRTGQIQQASVEDPEAMFRDALCDYATVLINCNEVEVEVIQLDSFADAATNSPQFDEDGNFVSQGFTPGGSNDRVLIRIAYRYRVITPMVGTLLAGEDGARLFLSTLVLQTEPYEFEGA